MKLSFSTLGCPEWSWGNILATAHDMGYDGCEIRGVRRELYAPHIANFSDERIEETKRQLKDLGLVIPCLTSDCVMHIQAYRERTVRELTEYIDLAKKLGVPYIRVMGDNPTPQPGAPVDQPLVTELAQQLGEIASASGVMLLIETNGWLCDTEKLARLLEKINSPGVGALWDTHHPYRFLGESPETSWQNIGRWTKHTHFKDSLLEGGKLRYTMLGYGDMPIEGFVSVLGGGGYAGFLSLEWVRRWDLTLEEPGIAFAQFVSVMRGYEQ